MSRHHSRARTGGGRASLYDEITDKIISELEAGRVPWVQPWGTAAAKASLSMPKNASTNRSYSGVNILLLWGSTIENGFTRQSWLTFRQALSLGGHVRKGERGTTVVYADRFVPSDEKRRAAETGEEAQAIPFLKRFTVFNCDQCDELPHEIATAAPPPPQGLIEPRVESLIKATGIDFRIGGNRAFYAPAEDYVQVPPPQAYFEPINWHRTALHELGHATGHRSRLNRDQGGSYGTKNMRSRSWWLSLPPRLVVHRSGSCRPFATPTTSAPGSKSCGKIIAPSCVQRRRQARLRIICLASPPRWPQRQPRIRWWSPTRRRDV
jgi:antirestriction protein ArdC